MRWLIAAAITVGVFIPATSLASSPNDGILAAVKDVRALPPTIRSRTRYLSLYSIPDKDRADFLKALSFQCNTLSREAEIVQPRLVAADMVAVVLDDYGWQVKTWDRLQDEPYFHAVVEINEDVFEVEEYGNWYVGNTVVVKGTAGAVWKTTSTEKKKVGVRKIRKATASAPWLDTASITELITLTGSPCPIVRADWFIAQVGISRTGQVGYYDFLELGKKETDFQKLIGADPEASRRVRREIAAVLARSGVALQNRRIVRFQSLTGGYWQTFDFKTSKDKQNVLRFLDGETEPPGGDASEQYGVLPNGLFAFWLQNDKGDRVDVVPPDIATDGTTASNDRQIYAGKSCIGCHVEGLRPIRDYARRIFRNQIQLQSPDYAKFVRLRQLYLSDLDGQVKRDQEDYAHVLLRTNGLTPAANAKLYATTFERYTEADLNADDAARELGVTKERLLAAIKTYVRTTGNLDPLIAGLLQDPVVPLRREHFEELFSTLQGIVKGNP